MRTFILLVCFTTVVRGGGVIWFFYDATRISVEWTFDLPCQRVKLGLMSQIDKWSTAYNCRSGTQGRCLYNYISDSDTELVVKHEWRDLSYYDTVTFNFQSKNSGQICQVSCHSEGSEFFNLDRKDAHYCSMRYLLEGSGLRNGTGFRETKDGHPFHKDCP